MPSPQRSNALRGRVTAVLNMGSGAGHEDAPARMKRILADGAVATAEVVAVKSGELVAALDDAVMRADAVVVLGGDGTIRCAAEKCGLGGKPLVVLPGGTMNMLPRALVGERDWGQALADTLADPAIHAVSAGRAQGEMFFCAAVLGAPSLWADAREALRDADLAEAAKRSLSALRHSHDKPLTYRFGDLAMGEAQAVAVICPLISRAVAEDAPSLEIAAIEPQTAASLFRLAFHTVFDNWRLDPDVRLARVRAAEVTGHGRVPAILDGELTRLERTVEVEFVPHAFDAIVPAGQAIGAVASL